MENKASGIHAVLNRMLCAIGIAAGISCAGGVFYAAAYALGARGMGLLLFPLVLYITLSPVWAVISCAAALVNAAKKDKTNMIKASAFMAVNLILSIIMYCMIHDGMSV